MTDVIDSNVQIVNRNGSAGQPGMDGAPGTSWSSSVTTLLWSDDFECRLFGYYQNVIVTGHADVKITGSAMNNIIKGNRGDNHINAGAGDDKIFSGLGKDVLTAGPGKDVFVFDTKPHKNNSDRITDYNPKHDTIWLESTCFKRLGSGTEESPSKLKKGFFTIGKEAKDKNDFLIYDKKTGYLYYDVDGSGSRDPVQIAKLDAKLKISAEDFFVF